MVEAESHLLGGDAPARVLLDGDCGCGAPGIEGGAGSLPLAQLGRLPEAAPREVPAHGCLDLDSCSVPLQSVAQLKSLTKMSGAHGCRIPSLSHNFVLPTHLPILTCMPMQVHAWLPHVLEGPGHLRLRAMMLW